MCENIRGVIDNAESQSAVLSWSIGCFIIMTSGSFYKRGSQGKQVHTVFRGQCYTETIKIKF